MILNMPHNPTGIILTDSDLQKLADIVIKYDLIVISDEVYEHITFDGTKHRSIASFDQMRERTLIVSSIGKTYSYTGWKVGWVVGPVDLIRGVRASHQLTTYSTKPTKSNFFHSIYLSSSRLYFEYVVVQSNLGPLWLMFVNWGHNHVRPLS